ncbi:PTS sugar transporter subunit IIA [Staphylococcus aureus]
MLVANHFIDIKYISRCNPYLMIRIWLSCKIFAIPHAYSEKHVHKTAMSMLILQEPIYMSDGTAIHIVVPIAAVDKVTHLRALLQLRDVAQEQ